MTEPDHVAINREAWTRWSGQYAEMAQRQWAQSEPDWGMCRVPERDVRVLGDVAGLDVVELGCGTAYFSAWLARAGARPVGVDVTPAQLATARAMQARHGLDFPLVEASAEDVPLPDASFDLALSEYGASIWCEPRAWVAEAARLLRPAGRLVFLVNSPLVTLCSPPTGPVCDRLVRPHFGGLGRIEWEDDHSVDFHPSHGEWIDILGSNGFAVERLVELRAPEDARFPVDWLTAEWAQRWPAEEIWVARKRG